MTSDELSKRFGWWWHNPAKALRRAFPDKSEDAIRRHVWPEYQRAAFNYELASRHRGREKPEYLLKKRFDKLTAEQMLQVRKVWLRKRRRPLRAIDVFAYDEAPNVTTTLRRITSNDLVLSSSAATDRETLVEITTRLAERRQELEQNYARATGWTVPRLISFNLRDCGDGTIADRVRQHVREERERLDVPAPRRNKGRANRSAAGLSFHCVEALDVWRRLNRSEAEQMRTPPGGRYDEGQKRAAARQARSLHDEWIARVTEGQSAASRGKSFSVAVSLPL